MCDKHVFVKICVCHDVTNMCFACLIIILDDPDTVICFENLANVIYVVSSRCYQSDFSPI